MPVIIEDMEMPTSCTCCRFCRNLVDVGFVCTAAGYVVKKLPNYVFNKKHKAIWCPLREVKQ